MKYLSEYLEDGQTAAFKKAGAFFAFSEKQFAEQKKLGVKYMSLGSGMICPEATATVMMEELDVVVKNGLAQDVADNGIDAIIVRELANHEAYYTYDLESTVEALSEYDIPDGKIQEIFNREKSKHYDD